jgi:hypothetical protein
MAARADLGHEAQPSPSRLALNHETAEAKPGFAFWAAI